MPDASVLSNYLANAVLQRYVVDGNVWVAVHLTDPGPAGDVSTEASGPGYRRVQLSFGPPANRAATIDATARLAAVPAGSYWGFAFWDAISGGNMLWRAPFVGTDGETETQLSSSVLAAFPITVGDIALSL